MVLADWELSPTFASAARLARVPEAGVRIWLGFGNV